MSNKLPATGANAVTATLRGDPADHGIAAGSAGLGSNGGSDDASGNPTATRNAKGYPVGTTSFAGGDSQA
jgi:hypothetical protein